MIAPQPAQPGRNGPAPAAPGHAPTAAAPGRRGSPLRWLLNCFSSVWLGITLLALLFIYSAVGSSGVPTSLNIFAPASWAAPREWRPFEMTEFEWFHWWPFDLLILLLCTNLIITTIRRIPLRVVNLGVWMIHTGIVVLCVGSVIYFSTKLEGETPVIRRQVVIQAPGSEPVAIPAIPGARAEVIGTAGLYAITVAETDPDWEILSAGEAGADKGKLAYSVKVSVAGPTGQFTRQLLAGYPQYTEDIVRSDDPQQPFARAKKTLGRALVDEALIIDLLHMPQLYNYLTKSAALYIREVGTTEWVQRPIHRGATSLIDAVAGGLARIGLDTHPQSPGLPRYNDYIADPDLVWPAPDRTAIPLHGLDIDVPAVDASDPLKDTTFRISSYLRYAQLTTRRAIGGPSLDPAVTIRLHGKGGQSSDHELVALDPVSSSVDEGKMQMRWVTAASDIDKIIEPRAALLAIEVPGAGVSITAPIGQPGTMGADAPFIPIEGTEFSYRVQGMRDSVLIDRTELSVAFVEIRAPDRTFVRWVFDAPHFTRDLPPGQSLPTHEVALPPDDRIRMAYRPGNAPPPILIAAGPDEDDLNVVITTRDGTTRHAAKAGDRIEIIGGASLEILAYAAHTFTQTRPEIIPPAQRDRSLEEMLSMIRVDLPQAPSIAPLWLPYHLYAFATGNENLRRYPYRPAVIRMPDGRAFEILFSRERLDLPAAVVLDDFQLRAQVGGFTGENLSIRDWISVLRFETSDPKTGAPASWTPRMRVSVNEPAEYDGFWYFQSQWDPPMASRFAGDPPSSGLNYTVLGVGNRNGVNVQLAGCCIAVAGMIFSFYIKPIIKRRRQQKVQAQVDAARAAGVPFRNRAGAVRSTVEHTS